MARLTHWGIEDARERARETINRVRAGLPAIPAQAATFGDVAASWRKRHVDTVVHGNGDSIDGFADIVVVNYEILDRHVGWLGNLGFRGMVVDEAHFIKNKTSQRSQHVLQLSERIRSRTVRPLLMALTGTPLINDIEDFRAIWQFLGWIDDKKPLAPLMHALEETGLTPADSGFYTAARGSVIDMGIVRRRKVDVASDIPARRIADLPVELDDEAGRSIRAAERDLARRLVSRYDSALENRRSSVLVSGIDHELVRRVARWEREDTNSSATEENVFGVMRRIGQAKAGLSADYAAQLARSVGKVVFFAKHIDVMDVAEETFAKRGLRYSSIRGDQTPRQRQANIDAFVNDPDVAVVVCSLTAAGVGLNLQVASNVVLAELSWTDAEQTQAIDRVHRIGQAEPVTAWRIIAAQTIDSKVAQLIDAKAGWRLARSTGRTRTCRRRRTSSSRRSSPCSPTRSGLDWPPERAPCVTSLRTRYVAVRVRALGGEVALDPVGGCCAGCVRAARCRARPRPARRHPRRPSPGVGGVQGVRGLADGDDVRAHRHADDHGAGGAPPDDVDPVLRGQVGAEVDDADATSSQHDGEGQHSQLVVGSAREADRHEGAPALVVGRLHRRPEVAVHGGADDVLAGDVDATVAPPGADDLQRRHEPGVDDVLERTAGEGLVHGGRHGHRVDGGSPLGQRLEVVPAVGDPARASPAPSSSTPSRVGRAGTHWGSRLHRRRRAGGPLPVAGPTPRLRARTSLARPGGRARRRGGSRRRSGSGRPARSAAPTPAAWPRGRRSAVRHG